MSERRAGEAGRAAQGATAAAGTTATGRSRRRDREATREAVLRAATREFCRHGFNGARVEAIMRRCKVNMRMLYHYFGNKAGLYVAVLERVYADIRARERSLSLAELAPEEGMRRLIDFTFDFFGSHEHYIALLNSENMLEGRYVKQSPLVKELTVPLKDASEDLLRRGRRQGVFRKGVDPIQLYVSITAESYFHVSNRHTLSFMFDTDIGAPAWLEARREHVRELIMNDLLAKPATTTGRRAASR